MFRLRPTFVTRLLAFIALLASFGLGSALAGLPKTTNVGELYASQEKLGFASANLNLKEWKQKAKRKGISLRKMAASQVRDKALEKRVPVYIHPSGKIIQSDKHNGVWSLAKLQRKTGVPLQVTLDVKLDGTGMSKREFAHAFFTTQGKGRISPKREHETEVQKMDHFLQHKTHELGNDTLRSTIDTAFERLGLEGEMFSDYIEIDVGRLMRDQNIFKDMRAAGLLKKGQDEIPEHKAFKPRIVKFVTARLKDPALRDYLIGRARTPDQVPIIEKLLAE